MIFKENTILVSSLDNTVILTDTNNDNKEFIPLRSLLSILSEERMNAVLKEFQTFSWNRRSKYCGVCGEETHLDEKDYCKVCASCHERYYPAQFPAVIVSIIKEDKILLAHNVNFPGELHSIIAGFVDLGESLEETIIREVREEVGIEIQNIRYYSSQNWGFTSSLMIGFIADYKSGDIKVDGIEIDKADWFTVDNLPELPPKISIGRKLIDRFIDLNK